VPKQAPFAEIGRTNPARLGEILVFSCNDAVQRTEQVYLSCVTQMHVSAQAEAFKAVRF